MCCRGDNTGAPYNIADTTLGAEAIRLIAEKLSGAKNILQMTSVNATTLTDTQSIALRDGPAYYVYVVNTGTGSVTASLSLSTWLSGIAGGVPVVVDKVAASMSGEVESVSQTTGALSVVSIRLAKAVGWLLLSFCWAGSGTRELPWVGLFAVVSCIPLHHSYESRRHILLCTHGLLHSILLSLCTAGCWQQHLGAFHHPSCLSHPAQHLSRPSRPSPRQHSELYQLQQQCDDVCWYPQHHPHQHLRHRHALQRQQPGQHHICRCEAHSKQCEHELDYVHATAPAGHKG